MNFLSALGAPFVLFGRSLQAVLRRGLSARECMVQTLEFGGHSLWLVFSALAFFGAVMITTAEAQARRFTGNLEILGPEYFQLIVREFGPLITALLAAARSGASTSAELATMAVGEQLEALEMSASDPLSDLVAPRVVGGLFALPLLCVAGTISASLSAVVAAFALDVNGYAFINPRFITGADLACGALKAVACGAYIPLAASVRGMAARGGATAIGQATTDGVVRACFGCLAIDFVIAFAFQVLHV